MIVEKDFLQALNLHTDMYGDLVNYNSSIIHDMQFSILERYMSSGYSADDVKLDLFIYTDYAPTEDIRLNMIYFQFISYIIYIENDTDIMSEDEILCLYKAHLNDMVSFYGYDITQLREVSIDYIWSTILYYKRSLTDDEIGTDFVGWVPHNMIGHYRCIIGKVVYENDVD